MPRTTRPSSSAILAGVALLAGMATHSDDGGASGKPASSGIQLVGTPASPLDANLAPSVVRDTKPMQIRDSSRREDSGLAPAIIIPTAKALYLCDGCIGFPNQKTDLVGIFNSIRPHQYPHVQTQLVVFVQLTAGLGQVPCYIDMRFAATDDLVHTTATRMLQFPHRQKLVQLAYTIQGCRFAQPGIYLVQ